MANAEAARAAEEQRKQQIMCKLRAKESAVRNVYILG